MSDISLSDLKTEEGVISYNAKYGYFILNSGVRQEKDIVFPTTLKAIIVYLPEAKNLVKRYLLSKPTHTDSQRSYEGEICNWILSCSEENKLIKYELVVVVFDEKPIICVQRYVKDNNKDGWNDFRVVYWFTLNDDENVIRIFYKASVDSATL